MEPSIILTYILIVFSLIIGPLLVIMLYKIIRILSEVEDIMLFIAHLREVIEMWERIPFDLLKKFTNFWTR